MCKPAIRTSQKGEICEAFEGYDAGIIVRTVDKYVRQIIPPPSADNPDTDFL